jgi:hypothetical protein
MAQVITRLILTLAITVTMGTACGTGTETGNPNNVPGVDGGDAGTETPEPTGAPGAADGDMLLDCPLLDQADNGQGIDLEEETVLDELIQRLCLEIFVCDMSIGTLDCIAALNGEDGDLILDEFGILPEGVLTVEQVHDGLRLEILTIDPISFEECKTAIQNIECSDVTNNVTKDDFSNVEMIIPETCSDVFVALPEDVTAG